MNFQEFKDFYKGKKILVTGHTGFKGTWMCHALKLFGAEVIGYSLEPPTNPNLFEISEIENEIKSYIGDIRDLSKLEEVFKKENPEIVIHMAAQPLVLESYKNPAYTYDVNVMGTVNVLECIRKYESVVSFINVTTDKVYRNSETEKAFKEDDVLDGIDPYSNSKSCSELVTACYKRSFFDNSSRKVAISTCRAGNVIGGGDFSDNRIIPDCVRAALKGEDIVVRNPNSIRPYQHVLESVMAYLYLAMEQYKHPSISGNYNIGPEEDDCICTGQLVDIFINKWNALNIKTTNKLDFDYSGPHEANYLKLDNSLFKNTFNWNNRWCIDEAVEKVIEWTKAYYYIEDIKEIIYKEIMSFFEKTR